MKRFIHFSTSDQIRRLTEAKRELKKYSQDQIDYIADYNDDIRKVIDAYYRADEKGVHFDIGQELSDIKKDYLSGAIMDGLMTEDEFEDICALIDVVDIELSMPYA